MLNKKHPYIFPVSKNECSNGQKNFSSNFFFCFLRFANAFLDEPELYRWHPDGDWDNFGDAISQPLVERILGRPVKRYAGGNKRVLAIGSILHSVVNGDTIWGSGVMTGWLPECVNSTQMNLDVRAVRGPLTRNMLLNCGIECPPIYGDPALLFGMLFPEFKKEPKRKYIIIPHASETFLFISHPNFVSPREQWDLIVQKIVESEFVIASSLHGIVVAEAYAFPLECCWLQIRSNFLNIETIMKEQKDHFLNMRQT